MEGKAMTDSERAALVAHLSNRIKDVVPGLTTGAEVNHEYQTTETTHG